ncbi:hypothetical protein ACFC3F_06290 [Microbacterium sp. NPDC055910]
MFTSTRYSRRRGSERAVLALIAAIDGAPVSADVTPTTLIVRDSAP